MFTKYSYLSLEELLHKVEISNAMSSPIIQELVSRLAQVIEAEVSFGGQVLKSSRTTHECPVCESMLEVNIEDGGDLLYITLDKT